MTPSAPAITIGRGAPELDLTPDELREIVEQGLLGVAPGARVLAILPDKTRDDNTDILFPTAAQFLAARQVAAFDALIAQGTHVPMTEQEKLEKVGMLSGLANVGAIYDHQWDSPDALVKLGELSAEKVTQLTGGLLNNSVPITLNKLITNYDTILVFGATVPHEVAGFAGGGKYFFPGIAGPELTHNTHWLGALVTIEKTIGVIETPTRHMIEAAVELVPAQIISLNSVCSRTDEDRLRTHGLFIGNIRQAFRQAANVSRQVHIKFTQRQYKRVVALLDEHYDEMWVGGKASYRLGAIIEPGGELIVYAPHLKHVSETHGHAIEKYGYRPLEQVKELVDQDEALRNNLAVAAHLAHVAYGSRTDADGNILPRYQITLATALDEATCQRINLGYLDHKTFRREDYEGDADTLIVERAGRDLYLVE